jgi:arsenate reductase (glutaredoxin)
LSKFDRQDYFGKTKTMNIVYGITNCQTVQKARKWLEQNQIEYEFHDYKKLGIDQEHLQTWCNQLTWQKVLNCSGMMWRKASEAEKSKVVDQQTAIEFMLKSPTSIKRPIIEKNETLILGFDEQEYENFWK